MKMGKLAHKIQDIPARPTTVPSPTEVTALKDAKWVVIESALLDGEHVAIVFEKRWLKDARRDLPGKVLYFPPEIVELNRFRDDPDAVRAIHRVKKEFGAWLVPSKTARTPEVVIREMHRGAR
jgi:hypothetical protein